MTIEARIATYLDGDLDDRAASEVEAALVDPAIGRLLSEELMLRQLLATIPPDGPPAELIARLEASLGVGTSMTSRVGEQLRAALAGPGWAVRGPAIGAKAFAAVRAGVAGARVAASGVSTMRYSLGLAADLSPRLFSPRKPKPVWRRVVSYLWRRRK